MDTVEEIQNIIHFIKKTGVRGLVQVGTMKVFLHGIWMRFQNQPSYLLNVDTFCTSTFCSNCQSELKYIIIIHPEIGTYLNKLYSFCWIEISMHLLS